MAASRAKAEAITKADDQLDDPCLSTIRRIRLSGVTERHPHAELLPALVHRERHHPVHPDRREHHRDDPEDREHGGDDPVLRDEAVELSLRRADEVERQIGIHARHLPREWRRHRIGPLPAARLEQNGRELAGKRRLLDRAERVREKRDVVARLVHVRKVEGAQHPNGRHDSHDRAPRTRRPPGGGRTEAPPGSALTGECFAANAAFTMATGWRVSRSSAANVRPSNLLPVTAKNPP